MLGLTAFVLTVTPVLTSCARTSGSLKEAEPRKPPPAVEATSTLAAPAPLELVDTGHRWISGMSYPYTDVLDFAYVLRNPNSAYGATEATLQVTVFDTDGVWLATENHIVRPIRPGETLAGGGGIHSAREPGEVKFRVDVSQGAWVEASRWEPADFRPLEVTDLRLATARGRPDPALIGFPPDHSYFTGTVENPNRARFEQFVINVVHRRRDGFILAHFIAFGTDIFAHGQGIDAGERLPFRLDVPDKLPADGWYEVYARPWYDMEDRLPVRE